METIQPLLKHSNVFMLKISHIEPQSETALIFYFGGVEDPVLAIQIADFAELLRGSLRGLIEVIPSSTSLYLEFHVLTTEAEQVEREVRRQLSNHTPAEHQHDLLELPIYYHPEVAPDLESLAKRNDLSVEQVIQLHSQTRYTVASLGFAPGFAYLTGLDPRLASPRLDQPKKVAAGSLGIADHQTAIYPAASPGGWSIIGNCPTPLFDLSATPLTPFKIGQEVAFTSITREKFIELGGHL